MLVLLMSNIVMRILLNDVESGVRLQLNFTKEVFTMLHNIDSDTLNKLIKENPVAEEVISKLLENHHHIISSITHEIRNPLTVVFSSLQILEMQHPEFKKLARWNQSRDDIEFICCILNDISAINNSGKLNITTFSLEKMLKTTALSFAVSLDNEETEDTDIEFTSCIPETVGDFTGDETRLKEVILNLLINARQSMEKEGTIRLDARREEHSIIISCTDSGCGIPADRLSEVFDSFVTTKKKGTGLGLSLSKAFIEAHGGTIEVVSTVGSGTTFTITLPV